MTQAIALPRARARSPLAPVIALAVAYVVLWGVGLSLSHLSPTLDTAEEFAWAYALQGGYPKHPPLTTWIMHGLLELFGPSVAMPLLATFACIALALVLSWQLAVQFMPRERALLGLALSALVGYYNFAADTFNHNVVLLPFQAALVLCAWYALRRGDWRLWALTGLLAGLAMLVKYVAVFPVAGLLLYVALDRTARVRRTWLGMLLAAVVALLVLSPHLVWLRQHDYLPLRYMESVTRPVNDPAELASMLWDFFIQQFSLLLPMLAVVGWLLWRGRGMRPQPLRRAPASDRLFLWCSAAAPLAIEVLYGVVMRTPMAPRWGTTMFLLAGWLLLDLIAHKPLPYRRTIWTAVLSVHALSWGFNVIVRPLGAHALGVHSRTLFPGSELAQRALETWQARTGQPLRLVIADVWLAGNVVTHSRPVAVMVDGELEWSPWIDAEDVARCGALVLEDLSVPEGPPLTVMPWMKEASESGIWELQWSPSHPGKPERIHWGILPPEPGAGCRL